jgi:hypothetical protein
VFETSVNVLALRPNRILKFWPMPLITAVVLGVVFMLPAAAESIMLNVKLRQQETMLADVQMLNKEDEESEIRIDDHRKLTFLSQITDDGLIYIAVKVYERQGQHMNLVAEPSILTENQRPAVIKLDDLSITLEPNL